MKMIKWVKWIFSILILIAALGGIIWGTTYILNNNGIKKEIKTEVKRTIEKVNSNENKTSLNEIYNIHLNSEKHKLKVEYNLITKADETLCVILNIYFDGKSILEREVAFGQNAQTIKDVFAINDVSSNVKINENSFKILKDENTEYLLIKLGIVNDSIKTYYFLLDNNGDIKNENGILVFDNSKEYLMGDDIFNNYYDVENKTLAKIDGNVIYALEEKEEKKKLNLVEYRYYFKDGKLKKDKVMVFEDIKIKKVEKE